MVKHFVPGDRVVLARFLGEVQPPAGVREGENYWRLIGEAGVVMGLDDVLGMPLHARGRRVLVQFGPVVRRLNLACHNQVAGVMVEDALWCFVDDLEHTPAKA